jgi:hypothetical protein
MLNYNIIYSNKDWDYDSSQVGANLRSLVIDGNLSISPSSNKSPKSLLVRHWLNNLLVISFFHDVVITTMAVSLMVIAGANLMRGVDV